MKKILLFSLLIFLTQVKTQGQIAFSVEYGGAIDEEGRWMEQLPDSGYIMAGTTNTFGNSGSSDFWLVRADAYGQEMWRKSLGGPSYEFGNMVKPWQNGFLVAGLTTKNGTADGYIIKTDLSGNFQWEIVRGGSGSEEFKAITLTSDGGFAAAGYKNPGPNGNYDYYLVKFSASGTFQWEKNYGGNSYDICNSVQQTADGGYILGGQTFSYGGHDGDVWLVKTNASGTLQWQSAIPRPHVQDCHYVQIAPDGGYIIAGDADTLVNGYGDADVWLVKTNSTGAFQWDQVFGGDKKDGGKTVENTSDGGFIVAGITRSFGLLAPNYYLIKTDSLGVQQWSRTDYGNDWHDHAYRGIQTSDGGYAEFGYFKNAGAYMNFALVKLGANGGITKDLSVAKIEAPNENLCRSNAVNISVKLKNFGQAPEQNITINLLIDNGSTITTLVDSFVGTLIPSDSTVFTFSQTYDFNLDGVYTLKAYIQHRNADISYTNDTIVHVVTVVPPTSDPATTSGIICAPGTVNLSATPAAPADSMFWYDAPVNGTLVSAGRNYTTPSVNSTTTYYVKSDKGLGYPFGPANFLIGSASTDSIGFQRFDPRKAFKLIAVTVYSYVAGNRIIELRNSAGVVLQYKIVSLPAAPGGIRVYLNFDVPLQVNLQLGLGPGSAPLVINNSGATYPYSISETVEMGSSSSATPGKYFFFYNWYIFLPGQTCESNFVPVEAVVGSSNVSSFNQSRCGTGSVTLTANSPTTVNWFSTDTGGTSLHTGNTFVTPALSSTTTYYLQAGACSSRIPVQAIVNPVTSQPIASDVIHCGTGIVTLSATASSQINWYNAPANGTVMGTGSSFTTPFLNQTTTYYAVAGSVCPSAPLAVQAIINASLSPIPTGASACGPASVTLSATSTDTIRWYTSAVGGSPIQTGPTYVTPVLSNPTSYYAEAGIACPSPRVAITANIVVADPPVGTGATRCGPGTVVLSAQATSPVTWWSQPSGGSLIATGQIFTTSIINTTTFYAETSVGSCTSQRIPVIATVNITPPPLVTDGVTCHSSSVNLHANAVDSVFWFNAPTGGTLLGSGSTFSTPNLSTTTTYYAQAGNNCPSVREAVVAFVTTSVGDPVTTNDSLCGNGSLNISASSIYPITWYDAPGGNQVGTGMNFSTPPLSTTTTYYAVAGSPGCQSNPIPAEAKIFTVPSNPIPTNSDNCGPGQQTLSVTSSAPVNWYSHATGGNPIATGNSYTSNFATTVTIYAEANNGKCSSARVPVTATVYALPTVNLGGPVIIIPSGSSTTLDAGPGFVSYLWSTSEITQTIVVDSAANYSVVVTDGNGCSGSGTVRVDLVSGISQTSFDQSLVLFPNPSHGLINVKLRNSSIKFELQITDVLGQILLSDQHQSGNFFNKNYDLTDFAKGTYFLRIISSEGTAIRKIVLQ